MEWKKDFLIYFLGLLFNIFMAWTCTFWEGGSLGGFVMFSFFAGCCFLGMLLIVAVEPWKY